MIEQRGTPATVLITEPFQTVVASQRGEARRARLPLPRRPPPDLGQGRRRAARARAAGRRPGARPARLNDEGPAGESGAFRVQAGSCVASAVTTAWSAQGWGETAARGRRGGDTRGGVRRRSCAYFRLERSCLSFGLWGFRPTGGTLPLEAHASWGAGWRLWPTGTARWGCRTAVTRTRRRPSTGGPSGSAKVPVYPHGCWAGSATIVAPAARRRR